MAYHRQVGFSLLEVLVVLAIMGLIYALVAPRIGGGGATELRAATRQVAAGLRKARVNAIAKRKEAILTVDVEQRQFSVDGDPRRHGLPKDAEISVYTAQAEAVEGKQAAIRFYPDGSSTGGAVALARGELRLRVDVDWLTGAVTIQD
jgi:general secretion pathway protein H